MGCGQEWQEIEKYEGKSMREKYFKFYKYLLSPTRSFWCQPKTTGASRRLWWHAKPMVLIVSPELTLHVVADVDAVDALVDCLGLDKKTSKELKGNLKQLAGFNDVGADRVGRGRAGNWQKLEDVVWLQRGGCSVAFPVVGKLDHRIKLITQHDPLVNPGSLKNVLNGSKPRAGEWRRLDSMPRAVHALQDGASLIGITTATTAKFMAVQKASKEAEKLFFAGVERKFSEKDEVRRRELAAEKERTNAEFRKVAEALKAQRTYTTAEFGKIAQAAQERRNPKK